MALSTRIELEEGDSWTALTKWAVMFEGFSGRKSGLDPHRAGEGKLILRVPQGASGFPSSLGGIARAVTAQGDRMRVYVRANATDYLRFLGWVSDVDWEGRETINYVTVLLTDALGRLGAIRAALDNEARASTGTRIQRILSVAGWTFGSEVPRGTGQLEQVTEYRSGSAAELCQLAALSEPGIFVAQADLDAPLEFLPRGYTPARTLRISDQPMTPGVRWQERPAPESAEDQLVNQVSYTYPGLSSPRLRQDADSVAAYGERRIDRQFESTPTDGTTVAGILINTYKEPITIPREARVALHLEPEDRAALAARSQIGDLVEGVITDERGLPATSQTLIDGIGTRILPLGTGIAVDIDFFLIPTFGAGVPQPAKLPEVPDIQATAGTAWRQLLPRATGGTGKGFTYTATGLPAWMRFDPGARRLSGTPPFTGGPWTISYTATDVSEASRTATIQFEISVVVAAVQIPSISALIFATGARVSVLLPAASGGSGQFTYAIAGAPAWLSLSGRTLTGTSPSVAQDADEVTYTATDTVTGKKASIAFDVSVAVQPVSMPAIGNQSIAAGSRYSRSLPAATGGSGRGFTYTLTGRPAWLTVTGRSLTGTAPWAGAAIDMTWEATDVGSGQKASQSWRLTVQLAALAMGSQDDIEIGIGRALDISLPLASGGSGSFTYALTGAPAWVQRQANRITGTAPNATSTAQLTWTATDANTNRTVARTFRLAVAAAPLAMAAIGDVLAGAGEAVSIALPAATGGSGTFDYALTGRPSWLTLTGRTLSGTTPDAASSLSLTWTATDRATLRRIARSFGIAVTANPLAAPRDLGALNIADTQFNATWTTVRNSGGNYQVRIAEGSDAPTGDWTDVRALGHVFSGLKAATRYTWEVRAVGSGAYSTGPATAAGTTTRAALAMGAAGNISIAAGAQLSQGLPNATGGSGRYLYGLNAPAWVKRSGFSLSGTAPSAISTFNANWKVTDEVTGAVINRNFTISVTGMLLATPVVEISGIFNDRFTATWAAIADADGYEYRYAEGTANPTGEWNDAGEQLSITISELEPETEYRLQVRAIGSGRFVTSAPALSEIETNDQEALGTPVNLRETADTTSSLTFAWDAVDGADGYEYRRGTTGDAIDNAGRTTVTLTGLSDDTTYSIQVRAYTDSGARSAWAQATGRTERSIPRLSTPRVSVSGTRTARFSWNSVPNATSYLCSYRGRHRQGGPDSPLTTYSGSFTTSGTSWWLFVGTNPAGGGTESLRLSVRAIASGYRSSSSGSATWRK